MKVFISSTYIDLVKHRRAAADALERLGLQLSRMETFGARAEEPTRACISEIEESELFVGVYAHRYGFVPSNAERSITELEFDHAFKLMRPTFCFVVDASFPWPRKFKDADSQKLDTFKRRIESLVVRDLFTTPDVLASRVASSIGRFLIADPRRHGARSAADYARLTLADLAPAVFVDLMRLTGYAGSEEVRIANAGRHLEFVNMADQHLSDFRNQITRLATESNFELMETAEAVERGLGHLLTRLRGEGELNPPWADCLVLLHRIAERVEALITEVSSKYVEERRGEVAIITDTLLEGVDAKELMSSPLAFIRRRHAAQYKVIAELRRTSGFALATVRDDFDRRLAVPYFTIDLYLLRSVATA